MLLIRLAILSIAVLSGLPVVTMAGPTPINATVRAQQVQRNQALEQSVAARAEQLQTALNPGLKAKLDQLSLALRQRITSSSGQTDYYPIVLSDVRRSFPRLTQEQADLLCFYVLADVAEKLSLAINSTGIRGRTDERSEMKSLQLQMTMDRRSKFLSTLSNIMSKISTTQDSLVQNIK